MLTTTLFIAGGLALYAAILRVMARRCARLREDLQREIDALAARLASMEASGGKHPGPIEPESARAVRAIATAVQAKQIHVRPSGELQPHPVTDPWAHQGRTGVQASHDIAFRGR